MTQPAEEKRRGSGVGRVFLVLTVLSALGVMAAAVLFLLSDLNQRQYQIVAHEGHLQVQRGRFFPVGFEPYKPDSLALEAVYAPLPIPAGESLGATEVFQDRTDVDRALFSLLAGWTRKYFHTRDEKTAALILSYVERCALLPGVAVEQRSELNTLRADLALQRGKQLVHSAGERLRQAYTAFEQALELGTSEQEEAQRWLSELERRLRAYPHPEQGALKAPKVEPPSAIPGAVPVTRQQRRTQPAASGATTRRSDELSRSRPTEKPDGGRGADMMQPGQRAAEPGAPKGQTDRTPTAENKFRL